MTNWLSIATTESEDGTFDFVHDSTASVIRLAKIVEGEEVQEITMNYQEWEQLCDLIKRIS